MHHERDIAERDGKGSDKEKEGERREKSDEGCERGEDMVTLGFDLGKDNPSVMVTWVVPGPSGRHTVQPLQTEKPLGRTRHHVSENAQRDGSGACCMEHDESAQAKGQWCPTGTTPARRAWQTTRHAVSTVTSR